MSEADRNFVRRALSLLAFGAGGVLLTLGAFVSWGVTFPNPAEEALFAVVIGGGVPTVIDRIWFGVWLWEYR